MTLNVSTVLIFAALACFAVATAIAARWFGIDEGNVFAWLGAGLACFAAASLPWSR